MTLSTYLTAQNTTRTLDGDVWINERGNVEMTPEAAIDRSKILSDWVRSQDTIKAYEKRLVEKDQRIELLAFESKKRFEEILELNKFIREKVFKSDSLADSQIKTAKGIFQRLRYTAEVNTDFQQLTNFRVEGRITYDLYKFYLLTKGSIGNNDFYEIRFGIGYTF